MRASGWVESSLLVEPPAGLDDWLSAGIAVRLQAPAGRRALSRFPAGTACALVVMLEGRFGRAEGPGDEMLPRAFVSGPATRPVLLHHSGVLSCAGVMIRPAAASALLGSVAALINRAEPAAVVFGSDWTIAAERLRGAAAPEALQVLFDFVRARSASGELLRRRSLQLQEAALLGVVEAARRQGCSVRQFERRFAAAFGVSPKRFHRLARAEVAMRVALAAGRCDTDLALQLGYFDQSHLGRELRELAGLSPRDLARMPEQEAAQWWPLHVGAAYPARGIRPDFGVERASQFS